MQLALNSSKPTTSNHIDKIKIALRCTDTAQARTDTAQTCTDTAQARTDVAQARTDVAQACNNISDDRLPPLHHIQIHHQRNQ